LNRTVRNGLKLLLLNRNNLLVVVAKAVPVVPAVVTLVVGVVDSVDLETLAVEETLVEIVDPDHSVQPVEKAVVCLPELVVKPAQKNLVVKRVNQPHRKKYNVEQRFELEVQTGLL
jgi:hypothetical protein